jgi:hypothetical protein
MTTETTPAGPESAAGGPEYSMQGLQRHLWAVVLAGSLFALVVLLHGLVPGLRQPTVQSHLGQGAVDCLRREGLGALDLRCDRVGLPVGQPFLSGLPQTYLALFVSFLPGVGGGAARTVVDVVIDAASFAACFALARRCGAARVPAIFAAFIYLASLSIIHINGFAATFNGFVLLPVSLLVTLWVIDMVEAEQPLQRWAPLALVSSLVFVFTDGYAFVMACLLSSALIGSWALSTGLPVATRLRTIGAVAAIALLAVIAYRIYVPGSAYSAGLPIDVFRSMGADAATFVLPQHTSWWADATGATVDFAGGWGDRSAYRSNYLGIVAVAVASVVLFHCRKNWILRALAAAAIASLLLSLGPSLKLWSLSPTDDGPVGERYYMPASEARLGLPTSWLYEFLPGFSDMRATYRWVVVVVVVIAISASIGVSLLWQRGRRVAAALVGVLVLVDLAPNIPAILESNRGWDRQYEEFVRGPGGEFPNLVLSGERVLFLPAGNDFLANALIGRTESTSYNVGIDKNAAYSQSHWPTDVATAAAAFGGEGSRDAAASALGESVDVIVVPYFSLRDNAIVWPVSDEVRLGIRDSAESFRTDARFQVLDGNWFSMIRLDTKAGSGE